MNTQELIDRRNLRDERWKADEPLITDARDAYNDLRDALEILEAVRPYIRCKSNCSSEIGSVLDGCDCGLEAAIGEDES